MDPNLWEIPPSKRLGIWIDHRIARIVELNGNEVNCREVRSDTSRKHRSTGGFRVPGKPYMNSFSASEKHMVHKRQEELRRYYEDVLQAIENADQLFVLGPGEAKVELANKIKTHRTLAPRLTKVIPADQMTEPQLIAKVKELFQ